MNDSLERLLAYDRRRYWLVNGWSVWFRIRPIQSSLGKPYGIKYSFTLHDIDGNRILAYDNAHRIPRRTEHDHWHQFRNIGKRAPYEFVDGDKLLADFFEAVRNACKIENVSFEICNEDLIGTDEEPDDDQEDAQ